MKKFQFSLEKLLRYKEQLLDVERAKLGDMNTRMYRLEQELQALREDRALETQRLNQRCAEGISAVEIVQRKTYLDTVGRQMISKQREILFQKQAIERQTDKVRTAKVELSTVEKLREKRLEEYTFEQNKKHEQFIEEFVSNQRAASGGG